MHYSVIVVEDEEIIRKNFIKSIDWKAFHCQIIFECGSAEEALEFCKENGPPDILVTDIHLGEMDGIALCRVLSEEYPHIQKIIITGYDYFNYAKEAITCSVAEYVLKPVDPGAFHEILEKVTQHIFVSRHSAKELNDLKAYVEKNKHMLQENFFMELALSPDYDLTNFNYMCRTLNISSQPYYYIIIKFGCTKTAFDPLAVQLRFRSILAEQLALYGTVYTFASEHDKINCIFLPGNSKEQIDNLIGDVFNRMTLIQGIEPRSAGISLLQDNFYNIQPAYNQANFALSYDFYFGCGSIISYADVQGQGVNGNGMMTFNKEALLPHLRAGNWQKCCDLLSDRFSRLRQEKSTSSEAVILSALDLLNTIQKELEADPSLPKESTFQGVLAVQQAQTLDEIERALKKELEKIGTHIQKGFLNQTHLAVVKIIDFLEGHYMEPITLETLSKQVYLNQKYICSIIKKETNRTFYEILTDIRIQHAKEYLLEPQYKMYAISQLVGFYDTKAFSQAFKKKEGITPTEFRNKVLISRSGGETHSINSSI